MIEILAYSFVTLALFVLLLGSLIVSVMIWLVLYTIHYIVEFGSWRRMRK